MLGGTWIAPRDAIAAGDWKGIRERSEAVAPAVAETRQAHDSSGKMMFITPNH
jgi:hypothetical protein